MQAEVLANGSVHSSRDIFEAAHFIFVHESAFRPHETSESADRNCIFFKRVSGVVFILACARLSDSTVGKNEQSENKTRTTWERGRWRREKWEREPVSISLTTLFRPFLSRLDSAVKTLSLPSPRAFFVFLITERLSTTISEPGTG